MNRTALALALVLTVAMLALSGCASPPTATTHLMVEFAGQGPDIHADVRSDLSSRPTAARYASDRIPHPAGYTAHDQLEDWSHASHTTYAATSFNSSFGAGYFLTAIQGVTADGTTAYWALSLNGKASDVGMSDVVLHDGDTVTWTYTAVSPSNGTGNDPSPIGVTVDVPPPAQGETTTLTGSVNKDARVSIDGGPSQQVKAGRWTLASPKLPYGHTLGVVRVDDGTHSVRVNVTFIRLAQGTFEAKYTAYPVHSDISDTVWYDPGIQASLAQYSGKAAPRTPDYSVHDFMVAWQTSSGKTIDYSYSDSFGFGVDKIDGVGQPLTSEAPPYWCYKVNGTTSDFGISLQPMHPGDVVTWEYAGCA